MISDELLKKIADKNNPSVIGLDTRLEYLPLQLSGRYTSVDDPKLSDAADAILKFNMDIIDAIYDITALVKLQAAYYEMYGYNGMKALYETCRYAKEKGLFVIMDCKRNDIGSTAAAYSSAYIGMTQIGEKSIRAYDSDFVTVNPYLGSDGIKPFIDDSIKYDKGIFVLVKTSNPSSHEYQDQILSGTNMPLYHQVAKNIADIDTDTGSSGYCRTGAVIGATYPEAAVHLRSVLSKNILLVPGYGAQGADPALLGCFFDKDGSGAIINSSRDILLAWKEYGTQDHAQAARKKVLFMRDDINNKIIGKKI